MKEPLALPLFAAVLAMMALSLILLNMPPGLPSMPQLPAAKECNAGETRACSLGNCNGTQSCASGFWGNCIVEMVCEPGSRARCLELGCTTGYKVCNPCGTGYDSCVEDG